MLELTTAPGWAQYEPAFAGIFPWAQQVVAFVLHFAQPLLHVDGGTLYFSIISIMLANAGDRHRESKRAATNLAATSCDQLGDAITRSSRTNTKGKAGSYLVLGPEGESYIRTRKY